MAADPRPCAPEREPQAEDRRRDALQRYGALQAELAEHQRRCPEVALRLERVLHEANLRSAVEWIEYLSEQLDAALAQVWELQGELAEAKRDVRGLRWLLAAREDTLQRTLAENRDLRRRRPPHERDPLTSKEAFIATHAIADVIGRVTPLEPRENGHRKFLGGTCPFCAQTSLVVHEYHAQFACYSCGKAGTVWDFLRYLQEKGTAA